MFCDSVQEVTKSNFSDLVRLLDEFITYNITNPVTGHVGPKRLYM